MKLSCPETISGHSKRKGFLCGPMWRSSPCRSGDKGFWFSPSCSLCHDPLKSFAGRRGSEAAVTRSTRNRVTGDELVRGFESHPLRHLQTPRYPMKSWKLLIWMVEGFFCVQCCLKNPFPRLYSRCILPYLDFLRPSCFSLCTPKTYLQRLFHDGFVQQPSAYPTSIQWKGTEIVSQLILLRLYAVKERFYG